MDIVDHHEVYTDQDFKMVEVFAMDNPHLGGSNGFSEVIIENESDSDALVVDHDFGLEPPVDESSSVDSFQITKPVVLNKPLVPAEKLTCHVCDKQCSSMAGLKVHQRIHKRDTSLDCNICHITFPSRTAQSAHMVIHNMDKRFLCSACPLRFGSDRALQGHFRGNHKGLKLKVVEVAPEIPQASMWTHGGVAISPPKQSSRGSKKGGKRKQKAELKEPVPMKMKKGSSKASKSKSKSSRSRDKPKQPKLSRKAFLDASADEQESYIVSNSRQPVQKSTDGPDVLGLYRCNICKKSFRDLYFLERHVGIHMAARLHKCTECDEVFDTARALASHQNDLHSGGDYLCGICGKAMHTMDELLHHQMMHEQKASGKKRRSSKRE